MSLLYCLLFFAVQVCHAQQIEKVFLRKYDQQDGLSSFYVRKIVQDKNGFLYIATQEGLDRFDGKQFVQYRKTNAPNYRLAGIDIRSVVEDTANNLLWVLPGENGINAINTSTGTVVKFIPVTRDNENEWNLSLFLHNDKLFIGTSVGVKVFDIKQEKFLANLPLQKANQNAGPGYQVRAINKDAFGNLWVCYSGYGIVIYNNRLQIMGFIANNEFNNGLNNGPVRFNDLVFITKDKALVATKKGLRKILFTGTYQTTVIKAPSALNPEVNNFSVQNIFKTAAGSIYIAGSEHLYRFDTSLSRYSIIQDVIYEDGNNWLADVLGIFEDKDRNIWIGCNQGLAFFKTTKNPFAAIYQSNAGDERLEHVTGLFVTAQDGLFISMFNGLAISKKPYQAFAVMDKAYMFHYVFEDKNRRIHVSRSDRMFIYENNKLEPIENSYPEFKPWHQTTINSHIFYNDSLIILGTENDRGILIWDYKNHKVTSINEHTENVKLGSGIVNVLYKDSKDNIWVLSDNLITVLSNSLSKASVLLLTDNNSNLPAGLFFDMCEYADQYWIASYGTGILALDEKMQVQQILTSRNGLSNDGVYKIFPAGNRLVITTNNGLSVYDTESKNFKNYYRADGLHSNNFEEAVGFVKGGLIYSGGIRGVSIINPALFFTNATAPQLFINRIGLETGAGKIDSSNILFTSFTIPNNATQTTIHFSGINYANPTRTVFAYRIIEKSKDWIELGTQNFVALIGISPGKYHLQVKAANEDGVWSEPKELVLVFLPKWYQTWWFKLLVFLTAAAIIYAFYRYRLAQIHKQHEIRKNIATDLHDDLGSTLNSVKVFTNLAISGVKQKESLQQAKENLQEATTGLRDMIWVLDDSLDTADELVTRLKQYAIPVANASNIETTIKAESKVNNYKLTKEEKRNLFLICKEAINNSIKYSGASQIDVAITASGKKLQITITDNGKGFNVDEVKKGYGLKNMEYRAGQVRYKVALNSIPDSGTSIIISPV